MACDKSGEELKENSADDLAGRESGDAVSNRDLDPTPEELALRKATFQTLLDWVQSRKRELENDILKYVQARILGFETDTGLAVWGLHSDFEINRTISGEHYAFLRGIYIDVDLNNRSQRSPHLTFEFTDHRHPFQQIKD